LKRKTSGAKINLKSVMGLANHWGGGGQSGGRGVEKPGDPGNPTKTFAWGKTGNLEGLGACSPSVRRGSPGGSDARGGGQKSADLSRKKP